MQEVGVGSGDRAGRGIRILFYVLIGVGFAAFYLFDRANGKNVAGSLGSALGRTAWPLGIGLFLIERISKQKGRSTARWASVSIVVLMVFVSVPYINDYARRLTSWHIECRGFSSLQRFSEAKRTRFCSCMADWNIQPALAQRRYVASLIDGSTRVRTH